MFLLFHKTDFLFPWHIQLSFVWFLFTLAAYVDYLGSILSEVVATSVLNLRVRLVINLWLTGHCLQKSVSSESACKKNGSIQ